MGMQFPRSVLPPPVDPLAQRSAVVGTSPAARRLREVVTRAAGTDCPILIVGECGAGKESVARSVHDQSERRFGPFAAVNGGAVTADSIEAALLERAAGGTLFLDHITDMPRDVQSRLLRALEAGTFVPERAGAERHAAARIIAATTRNPAEAVREGELRQDLFYRVAVFPIAVPPLRARADDASQIAEAFLSELNLRQGSDRRFSRQAQEFLRNHRWPGNVRELRSVVERGFVLGDAEIDLAPTLAEFEVDGFQHEPPGTITLQIGNTLEAAERAMIEATLRHLDGSKTRTAAALGCSLKTLYNKLNEYSRQPRMAGA